MVGGVLRQVMELVAVKGIIVAAVFEFLTETTAIKPLIVRDADIDSHRSLAHLLPAG